MHGRGVQNPIPVWHNDGVTQDRRRERQEKRPPKPLDAAGLEGLALRYVERFATTRGRLSDYLRRKIRERGWVEAPETGPVVPPADPEGLAQRLADLGYIDDRGFAEARAAAMQRRGLGARRVAGAFREAGIDEADADALAPEIAARDVDAALAYAKRKRLGPFARSDDSDGGGAENRALRQKQLSAMVRAGHGFDLARKILAASPSETIDTTDFE